MARFDSQKRKTLKLVAGTGAAIAAASIGKTALANELPFTDLNEQLHPHSQTMADLEITIIKSVPLGEIRIVARNNSNRELHIEKFTGEKIALDGRQKFHPNRLLTHGPMNIKPHQSKHFSVLTIAMGPYPQQKHVWETKTTRILGKIKRVVRLQGTVSENGVVVTTVSPHQKPGIT